MGNANNHFNPNGGNQLNRLTTPSSYRRSNGQTYQSNVENTSQSHANTYHSQSWGSLGGRDNSIGRGSRGGSSSHSSGGASHGSGGSSRGGRR